MERSSELVCTGVALYSRTRLLELRVRRGKTQVHTLQAYSVPSALGPARRGCNNRARTQTLSPFTLSTPEGGVEGGARPDRGVPTMRTPGGLAELQGARESATAGRAEGRGRVHGEQVRSEERDGGRESRGHEEDVRRARRWDAEAGRVARGRGRHGRMAVTGRGKGDGRTEHAGKVW